MTYAACRAIDWKHFLAIGLANTASVSTISGDCALIGLETLRDHRMSKSQITTEKGEPMIRPTIHPGEILADELDGLGVSPTELARQLNVPPNRVSQIINGKRAITGDTALRLGHWFQVSAEFWLNLQSAYDLRLAEQAAGSEIDALPVRPEGKAPSQRAEAV